MEQIPHVFNPDELDLLLCALVRYTSELRSRTSLMERFASPEHLASHRAKIATAEALLERLKEAE